MPRLARQLADDSCYHVLTRGNNRAAIFHEPADYQRYGQLLLAYFPAHGIQLYHYCLMTNHVHLIVWVQRSAGLRAAMQGLNLRYALAYNGGVRGRSPRGDAVKNKNRPLFYYFTAAETEKVPSGVVGGRAWD